MNLTPREKDKLLIAMAAMVARRRWNARKVNHPERSWLILISFLEVRHGETVAQRWSWRARDHARSDDTLK